MYFQVNMEGKLYGSVRLIMAIPLDGQLTETRIIECTWSVGFTIPQAAQDSKVTNNYRNLQGSYIPTQVPDIKHTTT